MIGCKTGVPFVHGIHAATSSLTLSCTPFSSTGTGCIQVVATTANGVVAVGTGIAVDFASASVAALHLLMLLGRT